MKIVPYLFFLAVSFVFLIKLFFPPSAFINPDFGLSDPLHNWLPNKYVYSQNLKSFQLPFWEFDAGYGYPFHAEHIDTFYLPNLLIFLIFPFKNAIGIVYLTIYMTAASGMFLLLKSLKLDKGAAFLGAIAFAFSAAIVLRAQHPPVAQAMALVPLSIYFYLSFLSKNKIRFLALCALTQSFILFSFPQAFLYNSLFLLAIGFLKVGTSEKSKLVRETAAYILLVVLSLGLSAIQLLPSLEVTNQSLRGGDVDPKTILNSFPYKPKNLATFVNPFIGGKASDGTYNSREWDKVGVYWENSAYIGLAPFLIFLLSSAYFLKTRKGKEALIFLSLTVVAIFLALGKSSPAHILFSFPPLNLFRLTARFILFAQIFMIIVFAIGLNEFLNKHSPKIRFLVFTIILLFLLTDIFITWNKYNPTGDLKKWTASPQIVNFIPEADKNYRIFSIDTVGLWDKVFTKKGWQDQEETYLFLLNGMVANHNLLLGVNHVSSYQVLPSKRQTVQNSTLKEGFVEKDNNLEITKKSKNLLNILSVKYLITTLEITNEEFLKVGEVTKNDNRFYIYKNQNVQEKIKVFYDYQKIATVGQYHAALEKDNLNQTLLVENFPDLTLSQGKYEIISTDFKQNSAKIKVSTQNESILFFGNSYFTGWKAFVNGEISKIYPADINSMAVIIPPGDSEIEFVYFPKTFWLGASITLFSLAVFVIMLSRKSYSRGLPRERRSP